MGSVPKAFYAALALVAGATAAVASHVFIDAAGDYLLPHDAYDDVAHHSRAIFGGIAAAIAAWLILRVLVRAVVRRSGSSAATRQLRAAHAANAYIFTTVVIAVALSALISMEYLDVVLAGARIADLDSLVGGSWLLGVGTTTLVGVATALLVRCLARSLARCEPAIHAFLEGLLPRDRTRQTSLAVAQIAFVPSLGEACRMARRRGKRAPPVSVAA